MNKKYSIVCYLEDESKIAVKDLQNKIFEITGSRACFDEWEPHITVGSGVLADDTELNKLESYIKNLCDNEETFEIIIKGFGGKTDRKGGIDETTTPYVLWINVELNDNLINLVNEVKNNITSHFNLWYTIPEPYTPHVTIAFRDLNEEGYLKGLEYLKQIDFDKKIKVSHIALVEKFVDKDIEYKRFYFKK